MVIGDTSLAVGLGLLLGTVLGCLVIGMPRNGLFLLNALPDWQQVVEGLVILAAVALDTVNTSDS